MADEKWRDVGDAGELAKVPLQQISLGRKNIALSCVGGKFGAVHGACNHAGGPLGQGTLDGDYIICPWHNWKFHRISGSGEPGFEEDRVPRFEFKVASGRLLVRDAPATSRNRLPHAPHPLDRDTKREPGPLRIAGISTTVMNNRYPRYSTSEALLESALEQGRKKHSLETRLIKLREHSFRACEGYYSKSAHACTWPCSISQMDPADGMNTVYESLVFWADVVLIATPIRWGAPSSLYFKMAERLNAVQNQITLRNRVMLKDKVAGLIVTGGQDNVQAVVGQMMLFFGELGMQFPQFPFIAHSRGWTAEDMERNVEMVRHSEELHEGARSLLDRCLDLAKRLQQSAAPEFNRSGRKASGLERRSTR
jgi:multimeric flavodoxin WrbA/nitrite reductase/ring-hydroxylating ferredoxin subunit